MFFVKELEETILLHPSYFGPQMTEYLKQKLHADVEGTCSGRIGYIISVLSILDIGSGKVIPGTGQAEFRTKYSAIVMKPFKGEVVDGIVETVSKMGIFLGHGPLSIFVSSHHLPPNMIFDPNSNPPAYSMAKTEDNDDTDENGSIKVEKGTKLRCKLIGTRVDATEIFAIGSIKDDYLGIV
ncbi:DNA-directed RNA polymerase subunit E' [Phaffia rhodozyma]|uniref:DNA-directed RNA polymerase subunit E n=1 Tax=Phaffia rhodozyma TaxID=264483 RepID=A0A0F7SLF4_PHARH|nr:DNA-directed RNA polymerase subunit E' [Phaffia rhodozyma]